MAEQQTTVESQGVSAEFLEDFLPRYGDAWNSHDPERLLATMTDDIAYEDDAWPKVMHGHADVREFLEHVWRAVPDLEFEVLSGPYVMPDEPKAAFEWRGHGTMLGPMDPPGFAPTGHRFEFTGGDFQEYRDGKICRLRIVYDNMKLGQQLGILPPAGSRGERAFAAVQRLQERIRRR
jgi:steroid delta-isomerase-like uncharacterized protein